MATTKLSIPFVSPEVEQLVLWRDVKTSGLVFGGITVAYLAARLNPYPLLTILFYMLSLAATTMTIWAQLGAVVSKSGPPVPPILLKGISETELRQYAEAVRPAINKVLATLGVLASGKDLRLSVLVTSGSYAAARIFQRVSPLTLVFIAALLAFSLPKAYEAKKEEVDKVIKAVKAKVDELMAKFNEAVLSKIPKAKKVQ